MTKLEKAKQIEIEKLEAKLLKSYCPHDYDMTDWSTSSNPTCSFGCDCKACWGEEVEDDET